MTIEAFALSIAEKGFSGLITKLAVDYLSKKVKLLSSDAEQIKTDLSDHMLSTFNKCMEIKTILSDKKTEKMLSLYVDQNFEVDDVSVDQYSLVEKVKKGCASVVTGTGGGGKSMFMRYLWLSFFEDSRGKIPFFLELRQLNFYTHNNISDFIFHSIIKSGSSISQASFNRALKAGEFVLFLDGFDEINHDQRPKVEEMILQLRSSNPAVTIIVTSRPDERFKGWHQFDTYSVKPLNRNQVVELISKAPYDEEHINRFLKKLDILYETHETFLTTPLLAYMMLLTFSYNQDIPKRMFLFYEQAFEALYMRHDLTKGGYKRKLYTGMERQELVRLISYFCLISYYEQNFEFSDEDLNKTIDSSKSMENCSVSNEAFINDLLESLCLLKREGITYSFTHRSFQEYFAANCIARVASRRLEKLFASFSGRYTDSVLQMVYDINVDLFRGGYLVPMRKKYSAFFDRRRRSALLNEFLRLTNLEVDLYPRVPVEEEKRKRKSKVFSDYHWKMNGDIYDFYQNMRRISHPNYDDSFFQEFRRLDQDFLDFVTSSLEVREINVVNGKFVDGRMTFLGVNTEYNHELLQAFSKTGMMKYLELEVMHFFDFVNAEAARHENVTKSFSELLFQGETGSDFRR